MTIEPQPDRRAFLRGLGAAGALTLAQRSGVAQPQSQPDYTIRIAPLALEIGPGKVIKTTAYNGQVPGPLLRLREGQPVAINVINASGYPNLIHWHGLYIPSYQDGAVEEGSPIIPVGESRLYTFTPKPTGTRWYHSHAMAMADLSKSTYSGEFGFLIVEPASDAGGYDREITLAAHHWEGEWVSLQDFKKGPPPNNGLEVMYKAATLSDRMLGHGEPIRVREGERILFRLLNASGNMGISLALPGHRLTVVALDGNPVPTPAAVDVLKLDVAERADVIVEMNNPGRLGLRLGGRHGPRDGDGSRCRICEPERRAEVDRAEANGVGLYPVRALRQRGRTRRNHLSQVRENPRWPRRLQPLDHQRQILAGHEPSFLRAARQALSPDHEQ